MCFANKNNSGQQATAATSPATNKQPPRTVDAHDAARRQVARKPFTVLGARPLRLAAALQEPVQALGRRRQRARLLLLWLLLLVLGIVGSLIVG
jgi:hypothetical protein